MMRWIHSLLALSVGLGASAQWQVPTRIVLDGTNADQRQITGLAVPQQPSDGASANTDRGDATSFAQAQGTNALTLSLAPALTNYAPGLRITFVAGSVNTGDASLNIDGLGPVPLRKNVNAPLDSADLKPGIPVEVVHDGAAFQVVNQLYPGCPTGYSPISRDVCIADQPNDTLNWYAANNWCNDHGARLCGFQEWLQGCLKYPAFVATVSDYEWVDSGANYNNMAKNMGWTDTSTAGDCRAGSRQIPTVNFRSRCCYDR